MSTGLADAGAAATAPSPATPAAWAQAWHDSDLHSRVVAGLGEVPHLLDAALPTDVGVHAAPAHWHSALYGDLVLGRVGSTFAAPDCYQSLRSHGLAWDTAAVADALVGFLAHLREAGHVDYPTRADGRPAGPVRVLATLTPGGRRTADADATAQPPRTPTAPHGATSPPAAQPQTPPAPSPSMAPSQVPVQRGTRMSPDRHPSVRTADHAPARSETAATSATSAAALPGAPDGTSSGARAPLSSSVVARTPRSAAEAAWRREAIDALREHDLDDDTISALLSLAAWGTPVLTTRPLAAAAA